MSTELMLRFLEGLHASRLLDHHRIEELLRRPEPPQGDMDGVARFLEGNGWLTRFQIEEIREGRGTALTFAGYRLLERLPDYPSGPAFRAFHPALQKSVVLRWLNREWLEPSDNLGAYIERVQAAVLLAQPNVMSTLDAGIADDRPFIVHELVDGADLTMLVREMGALPVMLACEYSRQTALALQTGAERGIFHGDLSPARLILTPIVRKPGMNGTSQMTIRPAPGACVKVAELGLIPIRPPLQSEVLGEYAFAAPERLPQPARDAKADLWSLGASLYFMLSGRPPFQATSTADALQQLQSSEPLRIDRLRIDLPAPLADFVHRLLSRDPGQRPSSAGDVAQFLVPFCQYGTARVARPFASAAVPLASETGTIPNAKPVPHSSDKLSLAEPLPYVEPLPAGTSDSRVYSPPSNISGPLPLPDEQHHELFADQHGFDSRPLPPRKEADGSRRSARTILKIATLVIFLFVLPWTAAALYFTDTWPFDRTAPSSTSGDEKPGDGSKSPKKLKNGTRL
jgi:serine/threonine protein kinase